MSILATAPLPPARKPAAPAAQRAFKVRLDEETAERLKDFSEEFRGVSAAHVIAHATLNCMENADGLDYRYQLARDVRAAAKEDQFGMLRNRHEMKKYIEQLTTHTPDEALARLVRWGLKWEVSVGCIVRRIVMDALKQDNDCEGGFLDKMAEKAAYDFKPEDYPEKGAAL